MSRPGWENAETCARLRERVHQLAPSKWRDALKLATDIPLPWYRVQSLAAVASAAPDDQVDAILKRAMDHAQADSDAYRRVAVTSWVIKAAVARGRTPLAKKLLADALHQCAEVTPIKSRGSALELLLPAAATIGESETRRAASALLDVAHRLKTDRARKWRKWGTSFVNRLASTLARSHPGLTKELLVEYLGADKATAILARHAAR